MKLADMKFKATSIDGKEYFFGWKDIYAVDGSKSIKCASGVYAHTLQGELKLTHNLDEALYEGVNDYLEIEVL